MRKCTWRTSRSEHVGVNRQSKHAGACRREHAGASIQGRVCRSEHAGMNMQKAEKRKTKSSRGSRARPRGRGRRGPRCPTRGGWGG